MASFPNPLPHLRRRKWDYCVLLLWCAISLALLAHHEPWRDEVRAWILAATLNPWQLLNAMQYDGHPILWHYWLKLFTVWRHPDALLLASWLLCLMGSALWIFRAPFPPWFRWTFLFTAPMLYWFPVISRNYALFPPLLFAIAALHPRRWEHPWWYGMLVALLANTHLTIEGVVLSLFLIDLHDIWEARRNGLREWHRRLIAPALTLLGVLGAFLTVIRSLFRSGWAASDSPNKSQWVLDNIHRFGTNVAIFAYRNQFTFLPLFLLAVFIIFSLFYSAHRRATPRSG